MPADWSSFITSVSSKLSGQSIKGSYDPMGGDVDDFAAYLSNQYVSAVSQKAQTPFGNLHQSGDTGILTGAFSRAFKILEEERSPTFEEKMTDPMYKKLDDPLPEVNFDEYMDKFDLDFLAWAELNGESIPDFTYSLFFSQFPNFPTTRDQQVLEIARRIVQKYDGTVDYLQWIYTLKLNGRYNSGSNNWATAIFNKVVELIEGISNVPIKIGDKIQGIAKHPVNTSLLINPTIDNNTELSASDEVISGTVIEIKQEGRETDYVIQYSKEGQIITRTVRGGTENKRLDPKDFKNVKDINISKELYQEEHVNDPTRIPDYMVASFITNFTYDKRYESSIFKKISGNNYYIGASIDRNLTEDSVLYNNYLDSFFNGEFGSGLDYLDTSSYVYLNYQNTISQQFNSIASSKLSAYQEEGRRFNELKRRYIQELADSSKVIDEGYDQNDPYFIMATGVLGYWVSTLQQPFSANPPVPPCVLTAPLGGFFIPIYYGSRKRLADYLRRAFNSGKMFKSIPERKISATAVASALAFSFASNLIEFKLIYNGGVPTTNGPVPMIGFIPVVF